MSFHRAAIIGLPQDILEFSGLISDPQLSHPILPNQTCGPVSIPLARRLHLATKMIDDTKYEGFAMDFIWRGDELSRRVTPSEASRTVNSTIYTLPTDIERMTAITKAIMDPTDNLSGLRQEADREFVQTHRRLYQELSLEIGTDETELFEQESKINEMVAKLHVGPQTQVRNLSRVIFFSHLADDPILPSISPIGDAPGPNQWPPLSDKFYLAMSQKYRDTLTNMQADQKPDVANEIGRTCEAFVRDPERTMRGLEPHSSRWS